MLKLIQISVQMLHRELVVGANNSPFKQAADALNGVGMNVAAHPFFFAVFDRLVARVRIAQVAVRNVIVGVDRFRLWSGVVRNELLKQEAIGRFDNLQPNLSAPLNRSDNAAFICPSVLGVAFPAKVGFVNLECRADGQR
jgi:hypothetical protein